MNNLLQLIHKGNNPYKNLDLMPRLEWGYQSHHRIFGMLMQFIRPSFIVEIGTFCGESAIFIAKIAKAINLHCEILCVDTFVSQDWHEDSHFTKQAFKNGRPTTYEQFLNNVVHEEVQDIIVPLCMDSLTASQIVERIGMRPQMVYIDAGHEKPECLRDLEIWYPLLDRTRMSSMIGDDYCHPPFGVKRATDELRLLNKQFDTNFNAVDEKWFYVHVPEGLVG